MLFDVNTIKAIDGNNSSWKTSESSMQSYLIASACNAFRGHVLKWESCKIKEVY